MLYLRIDIQLTKLLVFIMMMKSVKFLAAAAMLAAAVSCASIEKMAQMAENVKVT